MSSRPLSAVAAIGLAAVTLSACAPPYDAYDPYAHPNTTAPYLRDQGYGAPRYSYGYEPRYRPRRPYYNDYYYPPYPRY